MEDWMKYAIAFGVGVAMATWVKMAIATAKGKVGS